jgi:hypothetical protein
MLVSLPNRKCVVALDKVKCTTLSVIQPVHKSRLEPTGAKILELNPARTPVEKIYRELKAMLEPLKIDSTELDAMYAIHLKNDFRSFPPAVHTAPEKIPASSHSTVTTHETSTTSTDEYCSSVERSLRNTRKFRPRKKTQNFTNRSNPY